MAVDEAVFTPSRRTEARYSHTLRLYWFEPPALSIGVNQGIGDIDEQACRDADIDVVRRPTGGRALLHDGCATYALSGPVDGSVFSGGIRASYRRIGEALAAAAQRLGLDQARAAPPEPGPVHFGPSCLDSVAPYEILAAGHKLIASAQLRRGGAVLQHGSLRLTTGRVPVARLLHTRASGDASGAADPPALSELVGRRVTREEAFAAITASLEAAFDVEIEPGDLTEEEERLARDLEGSRYQTVTWTARR
jgi:lipoate-protein ligase A